LAKQLSQYLFFFSFLFLLMDTWDIVAGLGLLFIYRALNLIETLLSSPC